MTSQPKIYRSIIDSPLGPIEICGNETAIMSLFFLDEDSYPEQDDDMPMVMRECIQQLHEYFKGDRKEFGFRFQAVGTDFQQKIWALLSGIPYGKSISYLELSRRYGDPKAIRAVAAANGKNKLSIIIPCHRVVGSNGKLIGYGGGLWRKRWLLEHEAKFVSGVRNLF